MSDNNILTGSFSLIKKINMSLILDVIRQKGPISRSEISEYTKLTPATISNITAELLDSKLILEGECGKSRGGRKPVMLTLRRDIYRVIGIYMGSKKIEIISSDLEASIKYRKEFKIDKTITPPEGLDIIKNEINHIITNYKTKNKIVVGIGIGIHGLVDTKKGISIFAPNLGWKNINVKDEIQSVFDIPVFIDNDTRTLALGESWYGVGKSINNFFCINIEYGVGGSFVIDGKLIRGISDGAGEIGHTTVDINGKLCSCGNVGCLETLASPKAQIQKAYQGYIEGKKSAIFENRKIEQSTDIAPKHIFKAAIEGDEFARSIVSEAGEYLGVGVANVINTINPELVILNGEIITTGDLLLDSVKASVQKHGFQSLVDASDIVLSKLGTDAYLKGAVVLVLQDIFGNPEKITKGA